MIYVHVPFCRTFCTYCDFYSEKCTGTFEEDVKAYEKALLEEISARPPFPGGPDTLYIGGGTPSLMEAGFFERLSKALSEALGKASSEFEEFTVEVNPDDVVSNGVEYFRRLRKTGVNRISMGVQSFDDSVLRWMNRRHDAVKAENAFRVLREAGFDNISLDLIACLNTPVIQGAAVDAVEKSLAKLIALRPEHVSVYSLTLEGGTALFKRVEKGTYSELSQEACEAQTLRINRALKEAGYDHYEISNYALPGRQAVHNSAYWSHSPYTGYGPAAHSFDGRVRSWNSPSIKKYIKGHGSGSETLSDGQLAMERVMLALRTSSGTALCNLKKKTARSFLGKGYLEPVSGLQSASLTLIPDDVQVRIPEDKWIISDYIVSNLV